MKFCPGAGLLESLLTSGVIGIMLVAWPWQEYFIAWKLSNPYIKGFFPPTESQFTGIPLCTYPLHLQLDSEFL